MKLNEIRFKKRAVTSALCIWSEGKPFLCSRQSSLDYSVDSSSKCKVPVLTEIPRAKMPSQSVTLSCHPFSSRGEKFLGWKLVFSLVLPLCVPWRFPVPDGQGWAEEGRGKIRIPVTFFSSLLVSAAGIAKPGAHQGRRCCQMLWPPVRVCEHICAVGQLCAAGGACSHIPGWESCTPHHPCHPGRSSGSCWTSRARNVWPLIALKKSHLAVPWWNCSNACHACLCAERETF